MPIRMIHLADTHIGMENYGRIDSQTGLHSRLKDFLNTFDQVVDYAIDNQVDLVVFAGDAFKHRDPNPTQQREFATRIARMAAAGVVVVLLVGNHDLPNTEGKAHSIEIYDTLRVPNVYVAKKPDLIRVTTRNGDVQVIPIPYATKSMLLAKDKYRGMGVEEINQLMLDTIANALRVLKSRLQPGVPTVVAAHYSVANATVGSERSIMLGSDLVLPLSLFAEPEFDYVALGHIHKHQVLREHPPIVYSGSMDRIDFGEEHDEKGFVLVDLDVAATKHRFIPVATRPFMTIDLDVLDEEEMGMEPTEQILSKISTYNLENAIVRMRLKISQDNYRLLKLKEIRNHLEKQAYYIAGIHREWKNPQNLLRNPELTEKVDPLNALEEYYKLLPGSDVDLEGLKLRAAGIIDYLRAKEGERV